ncbi:methyl-accepting chemotaxis protein [Trinickia caryophylli]|uniref:methyl-accepting chemotaxis protein n=1 Tax=Trinickia caryophylli TaxID=28094 RepID=UPI000C88C792|nr:methyl-accepting chemotaxis protein [Trinickia caryophylli]PMS08721.1 methyl-accepting chemotaxis protein [Trinickia caryophylli]TRX18291.1 HAMP domain-containing protein [Trinickia caryophylli]WQE10923.1 methyl-accepting chemotaxis protein [Trinickia caryophylli]
MRKWLFGAGIGVMGRLNMPAKLGIVALLFMVPLSATFYVTVRSALQSYSATRSELDGIALLETTQDLLKAVQTRRGTGASVLAGNEAMRPAFDAASAAGDRLVATLGERSATIRRFDLSARVQALVKHYREAVTPGLDASGPQFFATHTALVGEIFAFESDLADAAALAFDSDATNERLVKAAVFLLPGTAETVGITRGAGSAALSKGGAQLIGFDAGVLSVRAGALANARDEITRALGRLSESDKADTAAVSAIDLGAFDTFRETVAHLAKDGGVAGVDAAAFFRQGSDAIATLDGARIRLEARLAKRLEARAHSERNTVGVTVVVSLISIGAALYLFAAFALRTQSDVAQLSRAMALIGKGDLSIALEANGKDELAFVKRELNELVAQWKSTITATRGAAQSVLVGSQQIAAGNQDLSQRTETQAASLQETAASMEELTSTVRSNTSSALHASALSTEASGRAAHTGTAVGDAVALMRELREESDRMAEIVSVIEGIAFQTNILALNAAVEAARAGEQGKGFAVVAGEVRGLAHRSAEAAKDVKALIHASIDRVTSGSARFAEVEASIGAVIDAIASVDRIVGEIASASEQQTLGIEQVNVAIAQMDEVTQRNAALVEQSAAASASLEEQAGQMEELVGRFKVA